MMSLSLAVALFLAVIINFDVTWGDCWIEPDENGIVTINGTTKMIPAKAFLECDNLIHIEISRNITEIGESAFAKCSKLSSVNFTSLSEIKIIAKDTFYRCVHLENVILPDSLESIGNRAFMHTTDLSSLNFPKSLQDIGEQSFRKSGLKNCDLSGTNIKVVPSRFCYECVKIESVYLPSSIVKIGDSAFRESSLTELKNLENTSLESIGAFTFSGCKELKKIKFPTSLESFGRGVFGDSNILKLDIPDGVTEIPTNFCSQCVRLKKIKLPSSLKEIGNSAFKESKKLKAISIPDGLKEIGSSVFRESGLKELYIPDSILKIPEMLCRNCLLLTKVTWGKNVSVIGQQAFKLTPSLKNITFGDKLEKIEEKAFQLSGLRSIHFPDSLKYIGRLAFRENSDLSSVEFGNEVEVIENGAFEFYYLGIGGSKIGTIKSISFRNGSTGHLSIGNHAFARQNMEEVVIPPTVTNLMLGSNAFMGCPRLAKVELGASVTTLSIQKHVFQGTNLSTSTIYFPRALRSLELLYNSKIFVECDDDNPSSSSSCRCINGYETVPDIQNSDFFTCSLCPPRTSSNATNTVCYPCPQGTYNAMSASECLLCDAGKYSMEGEASCHECNITQFSFLGSSACQECPPGRKCSHTGLSFENTILCDEGSYNDEEGQKSCKLCPSGTFQNKKGQAFCSTCASGKFNPGNGSISSSDCLDCPRGTFSPGGGANECTPCIGNTYTDVSGMSTCKPCAKFEIANDAKSGCVVDGVLSVGLYQTIFDNGVAITGAIIMTMAFVLIAGIVTYYREAYPSKLANYTRFEAMYNSFLAGFGFGSSVFLIISISIANPGLGVAMILFRLLHFIGGAALLVVMFGSESFVKEKIDTHVEGASLLRNHLDPDIIQSHLFVMEMVSFAAMLDVTMFQFMPWKKSRFYVLSEGYPSLGVMKYCLCLKLVELLAIFACEVIFLVTMPGDIEKMEQAVALLGMGVTLLSVHLIHYACYSYRTRYALKNYVNGKWRSSVLSSSPVGVQDIELRVTSVMNKMHAGKLSQLNEDKAGEVDQERIISQQSDQLKDLDREIDELSRELNSLETEG